MEAYQSIQLIIAPDVQKVLEKRRILSEDLQRAIHSAEASGRWFTHPKTGRRKASFRPYKATVWVEYSPAPQGYVIHNAYSHRMEIIGGPRT